MFAKKILILGSSGAGKTTLACELSTRLDLPLIHLDAHYWKPGWVSSTPESWQQRVEGLVVKERWIMDGNYGGTLSVRLAHADAVIFLDMPRWTCLWRICKRRLRYAGKTRPDMAPDCPERLNWEFIRYVWTYSQQRRPRVMQQLQEVAEKKTVVVLRSPAQVRQFLRSPQQ